MARFLLRLLALALITLLLLSVIVFAAAQILPGDIGRFILGPLAPQSAVDVLDKKLGVDKPLYQQYWSWITGVLHGDFGTSLAYGTPVRPLLATALENSLKLALEAFVIVVPLSIVGGVYAALRYGRLPDRTITVFGLSASVIPEFVWGVVLILIFSIWLGILPAAATAPPGSSVLVEAKYLLLPACALALVLFGYIARMARAGTVEALDSEYARTAYLKGLPTQTVVRRHVLRNSLLPTITVIATQVGYLFGGLVAIEQLFNYQGIGTLILNAARSKDVPMLEAGVLTVGVCYLLATLVADLLFALLNPRIRHATFE
jgi:peptide/nickel transport system permease protein